MKVLIIDDEQGVLKMYGQYFKMSGIEPIVAIDGKTGIQKAKEEKPDVILLDIIMPRYNGLDVLKDLKTDEQTKNIPIYLLTNLPEESSGQKAKELGANGYLVKAKYEPKMLVDLVKKVINNPEEQANFTDENAQPSAE